MQRYTLKTTDFGFHDITGQVLQAVRESGLDEGICVVYCPHTTAAITINENADPAVQHDLKIALHKISPDRASYTHMEGNSPAHLLSSVIGASQTIPIFHGTLSLGTWQGIYFCEFDGPRSRNYYVQTIG